MRKDFAAFILSHGRPDRVFTLRALQRTGYTGEWFIVIDDQDKTADQYKERYGDRVIVFDKKKAAEETDAGNNFNDLRSPLFARNALWKIAKDLGFDYFIELDDDYTTFQFRFGRSQGNAYRKITDIEQPLTSLVEFIERVPQCLCIAMSQGGDHIGGAPEAQLKRKSMNTFVLATARPFQWVSFLNDDVTTYLIHGHRGKLFFTFTPYQVLQQLTQTNPGGLTETYLSAGTFQKSFYSVMYCPGFTRVGELIDRAAFGRGGALHPRLHHDINWNRAVPKILREDIRKPCHKGKSTKSKET